MTAISQRKETKGKYRKLRTIQGWNGLLRKGKVMANYIIRIFKSWGAREADRRWVNNYEVSSPSLGPELLDTTINAIVSAEQAIHLPQVQFLSATVSTWAPDSNPYNPLTFQTQDLSVQGTRGVATIETLDSNVCYAVRFVCNSGRNGRRFYRGCLLETDVNGAGDGRFQLTAAGTLYPGGANFVSFQTALAPLLSAGASPDKIVLVGGTAPVITRPVVSLVVGGVTINRRNHRYFDRA